MDNIAIVTWTNTECSDVWPMYFGRLDRHAGFLKSYVFLNEYSEKIDKKHIQITNNENESFFERLVKCLQKVDEDYIIYSQEDHIFYDNVDSQKLEELFLFFSESKYSSLRLIKSGELAGRKIKEGIYEIPRESPYLYSQQSAIWKKKDLIRLMNFYQPVTFRDVEAYGSLAMNNINQRSCYCYYSEPRRGSLHWDSYVFPYIATAIGKGKWNLSQYPILLKEALEEYSIDYRVRGIYGSQNGHI